MVDASASPVVSFAPAEIDRKRQNGADNFKTEQAHVHDRAQKNPHRTPLHAFGASWQML